jgi:hypothetical protein
VVRDFLFSFEPFLAFCTPCVGLVGITAEATIVHDLDFGEQCGKRACGSGFCRAAFAADQNASDARINGIQNERTPHALLSYDGCEGKDRWHLIFELRDVIITRESKS